MVQRRILAITLVVTTAQLAGAPRGAAADPATCATRSESRSLDFWLGDWTISYPGAPSASHSTVSLALDKCLLVESWDGGKGHRGQNLFAYSADDQSWRGIFADNQGRVHTFEGTVTAGTAEFRGTNRGADGAAVLDRIRVVRVSPDRVTQTWEKSSDRGRTWTTVFHGDYARTR